MYSILILGKGLVPTSNRHVVIISAILRGPISDVGPVFAESSADIRILSGLSRRPSTNVYKILNFGKLDRPIFEKPERASTAFPPSIMAVHSRLFLAFGAQ
jgi:hypothetical protein